MKVLLALLMLFFSPLPARVTAHALDRRYAAAADGNVWFYEAESEESKLFLIPETYYVCVLYAGETYSAVEYLINEAPYKKIVGYCRTDALTFVDFVPERPYLLKQLTVSYTLPAGSGLGDEFSTVERTFVYYGTRYEKGQLYLYVLSEGKFGYIPAEEEPPFERNNDVLAPVGPSDEVVPSPEAGTLSAAEIVIICLVCAAAVVCAVFVIRGGRKEPPAG